MKPLQQLTRAAAALGLALGLVPAMAQGVIKIGEINSYKAQPAFLEPYKKGMELAVDEINAAGGVNGVLPPDPTPRAEVVPPRAEWYQEPRQIFDNFYWVGNLRNNAWVLKTSGGLIVIDTLFHYSVQASIVELLQELQVSRSLTMLFVTHNMALVRNIAQQVAVLEVGSQRGPLGVTDLRSLHRERGERLAAGEGDHPQA